MTDGLTITDNPTEQRRAEIRAAAGAIGIDAPYLSVMVDTFYDRIRADARLGPVFEAAIGDNWGPHLARMKDFWASVALNAGTYSGKPVAVHRKVEGVERADFDRWLGLFRATLQDTAPTPEAVDYLMTRAERIAQSLSMAMFPRTDTGIPVLR
jgi:hemoglobin